MRESLPDPRGLPAQRLPAQREEGARFLAGMLDDWYPNTRATVINALIAVSDKSALDQLRAAGVHDPLERLRKQASDAARTIAAATEKETTTDELSAQIKGLQDELGRLRDEVAEVKKKVPEPQQHE